MTDENLSIMILCADESLLGASGQFDVCCECRARIFVSDSTLNSAIQNNLAARRLDFYCIPCGLPQMKYTQITIPLTQEQVNELEGA